MRNTEYQHLGALQIGMEEDPHPQLDPRDKVTDSQALLAATILP